MKLNKLIILISIALILTLILVILVRENQHNKTIAKYQDIEKQKESSRLETYKESTKNYNELQEERDRLYIENRELKEKDNGQLFEVTGYSACDGEQGTNNIVATNFNLDWENVSGLPIVASNCIPLYSVIEIEGLGGYIVLDTGLGYWNKDHWEDKNWIDILFDSKEEAIDFGRQKLMVRVIK